MNEAAVVLGIGYIALSYPAPAIGGPVIPVNLYQSIIDPQIGHKVIERTLIIDTVEKSVTIAKKTKKEALFHWPYPWNWIIDLCALVIRIPFIILRRAGLPDKIEENIIAHVVKIIFVIILVSYLTYKGLRLEQINWLEIFK